jgi:chromosome segregation ATPase
LLRLKHGEIPNPERQTLNQVSRLETELAEAQEMACEARQEQTSAVTAMSELADARDAALREAEKMKEEAEAIAAAYEVVTAESEARAGEVESAELRLQAAEARFKHEADAADRRIEEALAECERRRKDAEVTLYTLYLIPQILSFQRRALSWMSLRRAEMSFNYVRLNSKTSNKQVLMDELEESGRELADVRDLHAREIEALGREVEANRLVAA